MSKKEKPPAEAKNTFGNIPNINTLPTDWEALEGEYGNCEKSLRYWDNERINPRRSQRHTVGDNAQDVAEKRYNGKISD